MYNSGILDYLDLEDYLDTLASVGVRSSVSGFFNLASFVLITIALWMLFEKAGDHGWAAIVPFYKQYVFFRVSGHKNMFWGWLIGQIAAVAGCVMLLVGIFYIFLRTSAKGNDGASLFSFGLFLMFGGAVLCLILYIIRAVGMAKNFGLSGGYAVGLIFIPVVFLCIMAFSKNIRYVGMRRDGSYGGGAQYDPNVYVQQPNGYTTYTQQTTYTQPQQDPYGQYGQQAQSPYSPYGQQAQQDPYGQYGQQAPSQDQQSLYAYYGQQNPYAQYGQQDQAPQQQPRYDEFGRPVYPGAANPDANNPYAPISDAPVPPSDFGNPQ